MDITSIKPQQKINGALITCNVVLDDCLLLSGLNLYKGSKGYFLVFPSKQDIYKSVNDMNEGVSIKYPAGESKHIKNGKCYDEFFHPVDSEFYETLLKRVVELFESMKGIGHNG